MFAAVYRVLVPRWRSEARTRQLRRMYAPVALVTLPLAWMILMVVAFTLIFWGTGSLAFAEGVRGQWFILDDPRLQRARYDSRIWLAFIEATIGLGLVALLISYLPTILSAYNGREKGVVRVRPLAGSPPSSVDLLLTLHRIGALAGSGLLAQPVRLDPRSRTDPRRLSDAVVLPRNAPRPFLGGNGRHAPRRRCVGRIGQSPEPDEDTSQTSRRDPSWCSSMGCPRSFGWLAPRACRCLNRRASRTCALHLDEPPPAITIRQGGISGGPDRLGSHPRGRGPERRGGLAATSSGCARRTNQHCVLWLD